MLAARHDDDDDDDIYIYIYIKSEKKSMKKERKKEINRRNKEHDIYCVLFHRKKTTFASPGGNTPQDTNCTATCLLSRKLFKLDEPDIQDTAGEAGTNS